MAKIQNKPHLTNFIKQNYIWILMIVTMSCIHLLYMYLIGARKQDLVYAAVLDAMIIIITVLAGFLGYSSKVKALSNALERPVEEQAQLPEATDDVEILYHRLLENQSIARSESESSAAIRQSQMRDYYSMWVHQIKTPISAMKLLLEAEREELGQLICDDEQSQCLLPLRYNNDKQKKPLFSRGLSVCRLLFNSFSKLKIDENYKEKRRLFY